MGLSQRGANSKGGLSRGFTAFELNTRFLFYKEPLYKEPTCRRPKYLKNLYY